MSAFQTVPNGARGGRVAITLPAYFTSPPEKKVTDIMNYADRSSESQASLSPASSISGSKEIELGNEFQCITDRLIALTEIAATLENHAQKNVTDMFGPAYVGGEDHPAGPVCSSEGWVNDTNDRLDAIQIRLSRALSHVIRVSF